MDHSTLFKTATALCLSLGFTSSVYATHISNYTIWDNIDDTNNHPVGNENKHSYWGGSSKNPKYQAVDVIGSADKFDIQKAIINHKNNTLTIDIYTGFITNGGLGYGNSSSGKGIGLGDLFITTSGWNPVGNPSDHYITDNLSNTGTTWNYVVSLGNERWNSIGDAILYEINNPASYLTTNDFLSSGSFRDGQLIAVDRTQDGLFDTGQSANWDGSTNSDYIRFVMDIDGTVLADESIALGFHWGMTCGNDVIEGDPPGNVPEPASFALLGIGLLGIIGLRRKTKKI